MSSSPPDMDEKYFEQLQSEHMKNFSKKSRLTTSKVVYSCFAQNCHRMCDQGELVIMLEKIYHPPELTHVHYLTEEQQCASIDNPNEMPLNAVINEPRHSFNYRASSIEEKIYNGTSEQGLPKETIHKVTIDTKQSGPDEEIKQESSVETQGALDQSLIREPIKINPTITEHFNRTKTQDVSKIKNDRTKSVKFQSRINTQINEEDEKSQSVFSRSPINTSKMQSFFSQTPQLTVNLDHRILNMKSVWENNGIKQINTNSRSTEILNSNNQINKIPTLNRMTTGKEQKKEQIKIDTVVNLRHQKVRADLVQYQLCLWKMNHGKMPFMLASVELRSEREFKVFRDKVFYSHDGKFLFLIIVEQEVLDKVIILESTKLEVPLYHSKISLRHFKIKGKDLPYNIDPCLIWGAPHFFWNLIDENEDNESRLQPYFLYLQTHKQCKFLRLMPSDIFMEDFNLSVQLKLESAEVKIQFIIFGEPQGCIDPRGFQIQKIFQSLTILALQSNQQQQIDTQTNNELSFYVTSYADLKLKGLASPIVISHPVLANKGFQDFNIWSNNSMNTILIENMNRELLLSSDASQQQEQQNQEDSQSNFLQQSAANIDLSSSQLENDLSNTQTSPRFYFLINMTPEDKQFAAIKTYKKVLLPKNSSTAVKEDLELLIYECRCKDYYLFKATDIIELVQRVKNKVEILNKDQTIYEVHDLIDKDQTQQVVSNKIISDSGHKEQIFDFFPIAKQDKTRVYVISQVNQLRDIPFIREEARVQNLYYRIFENKDLHIDARIDRQDFLFINPYIVQVTNNQLITIISTHDLNKRHLLALPNNFLCFAEMYGTSLTFGGTKFYQSSSVLFLTLEEIQIQRSSQLQLPRFKDLTSKRVCLNILELPQRFKCENTVQKEVFKLHRLNPQTYSIDFKLLRAEKPLKCFIDLLDLSDPKKIDPLLAFFQYSTQLSIESFNTKFYNKKFSINTCGIPMVKYKENNKRVAAGKKSDNQQVWFVIASEDEKNEQAIKKVMIDEEAQPSIENMVENAAQDAKIIAMRRIKDVIIVLDSKLRVQRFKFDNTARAVEYKKTSELTPQALIQWKRQVNLNSSIAITDNEVYFGHFYFQNYHNFQTQQDSNRMQLDFENKRNFKIPDMTYQRFIEGPLQSLDQSFLMYVRLHEEPDQRGKNTLGQTLVKEDLLTKSFKNNQSMQGSQKFRKTGNQQTNDTDQPYFQEICTIPYLGSKVINLLHRDDYLYSNLKFSSFTVMDDVMILMGTDKSQKLYIFDTYGNPIDLVISEADRSIVDSCQILNITTKGDKQFILSESQTTFTVTELTFENDCNTGKKYILKMISSIKKYQHEQVINSKQDHYVKLDSEGNVYQLIAAETSVSEDAPSFLVFKNNACDNQLQTKINQVLSQIRGNQSDNPFFFETLETETAAIVGNGPIINTPRINNNIQDGDAAREDQIDLVFKKDRQGANNSNESVGVMTTDKKYFDIQFLIVHSRYFVVREGLKMHYIDLDGVESDFESAEFVKVNINLREGIITYMLSTQIAHLLQFVYIQSKPNKTSFVFTWNMQTNMEEQMLEIPMSCLGLQSRSEEITQLEKDSLKILKGVSERLNYFIPDQLECYYDIRFNFPLQFLNGSSATSKLFMEDQNKQFLMTSLQARKQQKKKRLHLYKGNRQIDELKFSSNALMILGLTQQCMAAVVNSYSYLDLQYMQYLMQMNGQKDQYNNNQMTLQLDFMRFRLPQEGSNIVHIFAENDHFLMCYLRSIKHAIQDQEFNSHQLVKSLTGPECFFYAVVYPNDKGQSPLDIAMQKSAFRSAEIMLDMLTQAQQMKNITFSKYVQKHFITFLEMNSSCFNDFLQSCTIKLNVDCQRKYTWRYQENQKQLANHSGYIDEEFLKHHFANTLNEAADGVGDTKNSLDNDQNQNQCISPFLKAKTAQNEKEGFDYEWEAKMNIFQSGQELCEDMNNENQSIKFEAIEFPWVFTGKSAHTFIKYLNNQEKGSTLFANPVIQHVILFQWGFFWRSFLYWRYIPFMVYFGMILFYITLTHEHTTNDDIIISRQYISDKGNPWGRPWDLAHLILGVLIMFTSCYFLLLEVKKFIQAGFSYHFLSEISFYLLSLGLVIANFAGADDTQFRIISVFVLMQSYLQFVMYLRLFDQTAVMVSMLFYITKDIMVFILVFFVGIIAFANMFYVMQGIAYNMGETPSESTIVDQNFALAILATFNAAFGTFDTDVFKKYGPHQWLLWFIYVSLVLILCLIMLNMIIALMGDTYQKVDALQKEERMKAKCRLIHENEFIFARRQFFSHFRYIIVATVDRVADDVVDPQKYLMDKIDLNYQKLSAFIKTQSYVDQKLLDLVQLHTDQESKINEIMVKLKEIQIQIPQKTLTKEEVADQLKTNFMQKFNSTNLQTQPSNGKFFPRMMSHDFQQR